jgi:hypothetical protein
MVGHDQEAGPSAHSRPDVFYFQEPFGLVQEQRESGMVFPQANWHRLKRLPSCDWILTFLRTLPAVRFIAYVAARKLT